MVQSTCNVMLSLYVTLKFQYLKRFTQAVICTYRYDNWCDRVVRITWIMKWMNNLTHTHNSKAQFSPSHDA